MGNSETPFDYQSVPLKFPQKFRFVPFFSPGGGCKGTQSRHHVAGQPSGCGAVSDRRHEAGGRGALHNPPAAGTSRSKAHAAGGQEAPPWDLSHRGLRVQSPGTPRDPRPRQQPPTGERSPEPPGCPQDPLQLPKGSAEPWPGRASDHQPHALCLRGGRRAGQP